MTKVLVIHGAGMAMRGKAQINVFGPMTLADYDDAIRKFAADLDIAIDIFSSNSEGDVIDRLFKAHDEGIAAAIINPAAFMRGYPALAAAIGAVGFPTIEVHISNPAARGVVSEIAAACAGTVTGFGVAGYAMALQGVKSLPRRT